MQARISKICALNCLNKRIGVLVKRSLFPSSNAKPDHRLACMNMPDTKGFHLCTCNSRKVILSKSRSQIESLGRSSKSFCLSLSAPVLNDSLPIDNVCAGSFDNIPTQHYAVDLF